MWRDERRFAWQVGTVLAVLGAWRSVRGVQHTGSVRTATLGIILVVAGVLLISAGAAMPHRLVGLRRAWLALGDRMQRVTGPVVTALLYFIVITPIGWVRRTASRSPLARTRGAPTYWVTPPEGERRPSSRPDKPY
jgi:hypothetical protein